MLYPRSHTVRPVGDRAGWLSRPVRTVWVIGVVSTVLYGLVYALQRAIFRNGLRTLDGIPLAAGTPASASALRWQLLAYAAATLLLFVVYAWLLRLCRRGAVDDPRARNLALLFPVLLNLALLFGRPYLSIDVFSYIAHGYLGTVPAGNPYVQPASSVATTAYGTQLATFGWLPVHAESPYGPLWTLLEIAAVRAAPDIPTAVLLLKAVVVAASLASAALIWTILGRVRPADQLLGTLVYLWNPLIVLEFAAEGHNDALMILCVLAALALAVAARPAASLVSLALGVLTKYLPVLLLPALLMYLWRTRRSGRRLVGQLLVGAGISAMLAVVLYAPLWVGPATFQGVRATGQPSELPSPPGVLYTWLATQRQDATAVTQLLVSATLALVVVGASWTVGTAQRLFRVGAITTLIYAVAAAPGYYWPWYAALPLALLALSPRADFLVLAIVLSVCGRMVAPLADVVNNGFLAWPTASWWATAVGATLPLLACLLLGGWHLVMQALLRHSAANVVE